MNFTLITAGYYLLFITAMLPAHAEKIAAGMIKKGFTVSPCLPENKLYQATEPNPPSVLIVLSVYSGDESMTSNKVYQAFGEVIKEEHIPVYSVIVSERAPCVHGASNFTIPKKPELLPPAAPPLPPEKMRKMN